MSHFNQETYDISDAASEITLNSAIHIYMVHDSYDEAAKGFLSKILASVNQTLETSAISEVGVDETVKLTSDEEILVLSFGLHPRRFHLQIDERPYGLRKVEGITYVFSRSLTALPDRPQERKALWLSLKRYFGLS